MKKITSVVHTYVQFFCLDDLIANNVKYYPFLRKLIPEPFEYGKNINKKVIRDNVAFDLNVSDYMQWYVYADLEDNSWRYALKCLNQFSVVIDVGANIGSFSLKLAHSVFKMAIHGVRIFSFEPNPYIFKSFGENLLKNKKISSFIISEEIALGSKNETITLLLDQKNSGSSKVISSPDVECIKVHCTTIDTFISANNLQRLDFLKIDVEGYEPFVIDGALETIKKFKPVIYCEITPAWFEKNMRSSDDLF
ncbi:MAG: FkbM family methyltransferase [Chlorobium sp.]|jgi:FkbM family methyltransferase|nr:FkbM family methyltransferase [Chlorobium sp.]